MDQPVPDFPRAFVTFRIDLLQKAPKTVSRKPPFTLNNARLQLECCCWLTPSGTTPSGAAAPYVLSAACKAEQVNVPSDIWHEPNADMCLAASADEFLILKSWDRNNRGVMLDPPTLGEQPERQAGKNADAFVDLRIDVPETRGQILETTQDIIDASLRGRPLVAQTEFRAAADGAVRLEYPVKVINVSEREIFYQVDTGPVLVPDPLAFDGQHAISVWRQAFIAHNSLGCTEFLVNVPTPVGQGISVNHYSRVLKVQADNRLFAVD